ncbi:YcjX family protein [Enterobacter hormaechei]
MKRHFGNSRIWFQSFRPQQISRDSAVPHIRMDSALEFLLGDKLK